jgi:hypothetical protein
MGKRDLVATVARSNEDAIDVNPRPSLAIGSADIPAKEAA